MEKMPYYLGIDLDNDNAVISYFQLNMRLRRKNKNSQNSKQFSGRWTRCTVRRKKME